MADRTNRFACSCCGENLIDPRIVGLVEQIEATAGKLKVTSGYRCENQNRKVGGAKRSAHTLGLAVDVLCRHSRPRFHIVKTALNLGIHRIGIGNTFVHLDIDRSKDPEVVWMY